MMSSDTVPFFDSLASIYDPTILDEQTKRYKSLYDKFSELYGAAPSHIVRAPGRVNLIVFAWKIELMSGRTYRLLEFLCAADGYCAGHSSCNAH